MHRRIRGLALAVFVLALASLLPLAVPGSLNTAAAPKHIVIGFSTPGTDHGWLAAIQRFAREEAQKLPNTTLIITDGQNNPSKQIGDVESLIARKVDVIVMLPADGKALTPVAAKVKAAGIPLINLDRRIDSQDYYAYIGGDNYGIGYAAGEYIAQRLHGKGNVVEITGPAGISVTNDRSRGFADAIKRFPGIKVVASQPGDFLPDKGMKVMENILQAQRHIDAVYTHDDDMAMGVIQAIKSAHREKEMFVTGVGPLKRVMQMIQNGEPPFAATFDYSPIMSASAVKLAYLAATHKGMSDLAELEIPREILLRASCITKDNVAQFMKIGF
ncbi:MAG: substrate-binding domain-containing protein [Firmicutes bacterium]|nr:substrate-binding domain-containing protein [Bacillota bacterium]